MITHKFALFTLLLTGIVLFGCQSNSGTSNTSDQATAETAVPSLGIQQAQRIFSLPVHCLTVPYPNKLGQVLGSDQDLKSPKQLRPIFYGCFDWHSAVHGYWSIFELMQQYPQLDSTQSVRALLNAHITPENVEVERAFFTDSNNTSFERTYGWAWLFKVQESLSGWDDPDAQRWKANLQPLADLLVDRYMEYLPKLMYPIRTGQHDNSAFGLSLSLDYARAVGNTAFEAVIVEHAMRLFGADKGCPIEYEPSGYDFLSPCLEEAYLMRKVMNEADFGSWMEAFLPELFQKDFELTPAKVKDRTDGKLVHLDGLNYSRAACLYGISTFDKEWAFLREVADQHIQFSLPGLSVKDDYMGSHWLGTFALYALKHSKQARSVSPD